MNTITTEPTTVRHQVGTCPACRCGLWADVRIATEVHPARLDSEGKPQACAHPLVVSASLVHRCERDEGGEWTYSTTDPNGESHESA